MTKEAISLLSRDAVADCGAYLQSSVSGRNIWGTVLRSTATVAGVLGGAVTPKGAKGAFSALAGGASGISSDIQKDLVGSTALEILKSVGDELASNQAAFVDGRVQSGYYELHGIGMALRDVQQIRTQCTPANVLSVVRQRALVKGGISASGTTTNTSDGAGANAGPGTATGARTAASATTKSSRAR